MRTHFRFKIVYGISLAAFVYSMLNSPKADAFNMDYIYMLMITVGTVILFMPFIMSKKAEKFYKKALRKKE